MKPTPKQAKAISFDTGKCCNGSHIHNGSTFIADHCPADNLGDLNLCKKINFQRRTQRFLIHHQKGLIRHNDGSIIDQDVYAFMNLQCVR